MAQLDSNSRLWDWAFVIGTALFVLAGWWLVAGVVLAGTHALPTPDALIGKLIEDGAGFYARHIGVTLWSGAQGYFWGNLLALGVAAMVLLVPELEGLATQIGVVSKCLPLVAIGPIILVVAGDRAPSIFLAGLSVFFTTLIGALLGLSAAKRPALDLVAAYGGGRWMQLRKVRLYSAIPALIGALQIAVPAGFLGAIVGEYLGGVDTGVGVALAIAQSQLEVERAWAFAILTGLIALAGYGLVDQVGRRLAPWNPAYASEGAS
ncbi:ABC transporter permease [Devosia sp.]|uniref:ABC transporter permease n=1 Tax=Devosia sp. TaxID=1871048 RepID=UPI001ACC6428|nr:ABC transporter permease subunit [Devosia sp.]MBN9334877.1 ABC transporter permease subunit [Devosia sp.]